jgi:hypothetical protein
MNPCFLLVCITYSTNIKYPLYSSKQNIYNPSETLQFSKKTGIGEVISVTQDAIKRRH